MNTTLTKVTIASTLLLGAAPAVHHAEAATQPYYQWKGQTGYSYQFLLDSNFKKALLNDNVTVNGMKVTTNLKNDDIREGLNAFDALHSNKKYDKRYVTKKYDTVGYKTAKGKYFFIELPIQHGKLSMKQFDKAYASYKIGTDVIKDKSGKVVEKTVTYKTKKGIFEANFDAKNKMVDFYISANGTVAY